MTVIVSFRCVCFCSAIFLIAITSGAQCGVSPTANPGSLPPGAIPLDLRSSLEERVALFTKAQAEGNWDKVAELLGVFPKFMGDERYTPTQKSCVVSQMKAHPLVAADFKYLEKGFSSSMICPPLNRKFWTMMSETGERALTTDKAKPAYLIAYRDKDKWYFTPRYIDDHAWALEHTPADEFERDLASEVQIANGKNSPIEITELHAFRDRSNPGVIRLSFRFRNRTGKGIKIYDFDIGSSPTGGSTSVGTGAPRDAIPPHGVSRVWEETDTQYSSFCEDHYPVRIEIRGAIDEDGHEWKATKHGDPTL